MADFWSFLMQTLTASGGALFLLILKELFRDKLSPRWQFSVWAILGVVLLIPAGLFGRHVLLDWPLWIDTLKGFFFGDFSSTEVLCPIPLVPKGLPKRAADWLFLVYLAGAIFFSVRYLYSYIRLRKILSRGEMISDFPELTALQQRYKLPECKAVRVSGIDSAFVCGVFRPVLVVPADRETDSKVLLHELLHLKNKDVVWGIVIAFFRCIHWCNPLLWYCANQALNDMESLCDQRVLEHLEGEERREYGKILLSMANEAYARAPGTSSAANGGSNIRKRIEAIARFKRYPKGMGLVSVCILLTLISPLMIGSKTDAAVWQLPEGGNRFAQLKALTAAKRTPCTTFAGALDAYAKALLSENIEYRMLCMSDAQQEKILQEVKAGNPASWNEALPEPLYSGAGYWVYSLQKIDETHLQALLILEPVRRADTPGKDRLCLQNVALTLENGRWCAEPLDAFTYPEVVEESMLIYGCRDLPATVYNGKSGDFEVQMELQTSFRADNWVTPQADSPILSSQEPVFQTVPDPNLEMELIYYNCWMKITYRGQEEDSALLHHIGLSFAPWEEYKNRPELPFAGQPDSSGTGPNGEWKNVSLHSGWDNPIDLGCGGYSEDFHMDLLEQLSRFAADLYINGEKVSELTLLPEDKP